MLLNLLANALRHAPWGSVVSIDGERTDASVLIHVHDEGPGIPPADLARVFDRFYKGHDSSGSGLGLAIARSLAEAHGGTLSATHRGEGGTTFTVTHAESDLDLFVALQSDHPREPFRDIALDVACDLTLERGTLVSVFVADRRFLEEHQGYSFLEAARAEGVQVWA